MPPLGVALRYVLLVLLWGTTWAAITWRTLAGAALVGVAIVLNAFSGGGSRSPVPAAVPGE